MSRHVSTLTLILGAALLAGTVSSMPAMSAEHPPAGSPSCVWKTTDIIDQRIDVGAQVSLMRQMGAGAPAAGPASAIIGAIKQGTLAGVLLPPRQAAAQRAQRMTPPRGYWQLIPAGRNSLCLKEPAGEPPMIVYRENLAPALIDAALREAWSECGLPTPDPACAFVVDAWKPPAAQCSSDTECRNKGLGWTCSGGVCVDCETSKDCIRNEIGNVCTAQKQCQYDFGGGTITPGAPPDCSIDQHCPDGWTCTKARCLPPDAPQHKCFEGAHKKYRAADTKCEDDEKPRLPACAVEHHASPGQLANCLKQSYDEKMACKKAAFETFERDKKACYAK
jgi:hypothetical protein